MNTKEKLFSFMQKLIVIALAILLLVTMLPAGLFHNPDPPGAEGEFLRLVPSTEFSRRVSNDKGNDEIKLLSSTCPAYFMFDISNLSEVKESEINEVKFRAVFLKGYGNAEARVALSLVPEESFPESYTTAYSPACLSHSFASFTPDTENDSVFQADLTDYAKNLLKEGKTKLAVKLTSDSKVPYAFASSQNSDEAFRLCLKTSTGIFYDTDSDSVEKTRLCEATYVSDKNTAVTGSKLQSDNKNLIAGNGNETYLRFDIIKEALLGSTYSAKLILNTVSQPSGNKIRVYCINNNEWNNDINYDNRPKGEESEAITLTVPDSNFVTADISQQVCEAIKQNINSLTIRIVGLSENTTEFTYGENEKHNPRLCLKNSDNPDIVCASEAALSALNGNRSSYVTLNLLNSYSKGSNTAKLAWSEITDGKAKEDMSHINSNGEITRPLWFEDNAYLIANAKITSGDYETNRRYAITVPSQAAPDYSGYKFGDYIDIGNTDSEYSQKFECSQGLDTKRRWIDGRSFTYKELEGNKKMVLNLACQPYSENYLTLKLWSEDCTSADELCLISSFDDCEELSLPLPVSDSSDKSFIYATYAIPKEFTADKNQISMRISLKDGKKPYGIYSAYTTQEPFFNPKQFASQGERLISDSLIGSDKIIAFINSLKSLLPDFTRKEAIPTEKDSQTAIVDAENQTAVFVGNDANIAFKGNSDGNTLSVYRKTEYYSNYCNDCPIYENNGVSYCDFGDYKLIINASDNILAFSDLKTDFSGIYKELCKGEYYSFSENALIDDDSPVPLDSPILTPDNLKILPKDVLLFLHISNPSDKSDWRVNSINGKSVSAFDATVPEKIENITVKGIGGIPQNAEKLTVLCFIYDHGRIISVTKSEKDIIDGLNLYNVDLKDADLNMMKNRTLKVFILDNTESFENAVPKLELP